MNDETARDLGLRAVACEGWKHPGPTSLKMHPRRSQNGMLWMRSSHPRGRWVPDFRDPCTLGGLLALVREAHGDPAMWAEPGYDSEEWRVYHAGAFGVAARGASEAEALVGALEAAPDGP